MEALKKQRKSVKGKITRAKTYLDQFVVSATSSPHEVASKLKLLEAAWTEYSDVHRQIIALTPDAEIDNEDADYEQYELKYSTVESGLQKIISDITSSASSPSTSSGSAFNGSTQQQSIPVAGIKLPSMELPTFSGNQLDWQSFRDLFNSLIHSNPKISQSQKLHYLKNSMRDEAQGILHSIDITDANYVIAWNLLTERYENDRQLTTCHLKALFSQPSMSGESATQLRRLIDTTTKHVSSLKSMGVDMNEPIITFLIDRLDPESRKQWELNSPGTTFPALSDLKKFLEQRCRALEATASDSKSKTSQKQSNSTHADFKSTTKTHLVSTRPPCPVCKSEHIIYHCTEFNKLDLKERYDLVKKLRLCFNCLRPNHTTVECKSESTCRICKERHNTLLHKNVQQQLKTDNHSGSVVGTANVENKNQDTQILLSTAVVNVKDSIGNMQSIRVLLDNGSQATLITEACVQRLGLRRSRTNTTISGVGDSKAEKSRGILNITIHSNVSAYSINLSALVLSKLTSDQPNEDLSIANWGHLKTLKLADPEFYKSGPIDMLIGLDYYEDIVGAEKVMGINGCPTARSSQFGWLLSGRTRSLQCNILTSLVSTTDISDQLKQFWELEEVGDQPHLTADEQECESHFNSTHSRESTGRFVVSIPFKQDDKVLGASRDMCIRRLHHVERRLEKNPEYKQKYQDFMNKYIELGHMEPIPVNEQVEVPTKTNYLPHHYVLKESSTTTSLRVVFDASAKTSTGVFLNEKMLVGPKLQEEMYNILLRFRLYKYVYTADIEKMYRQIQVTPSDSDFQRILWRDDPSKPIEEFKLVTVTYGTASAPYLAVKVLQQLAQDEGETYPRAKQIVMRDFYVDDVMSGANTIGDTLEDQKQLLSLSERGGFPLRKWSSNLNVILESLPPNYRETTVPLSINSDDSVKALGLHWSPAGDVFFFQVNLPAINRTVTKRSILSETSKLFDPLGWLAPVIITAKILLQELWLLGASWDEKLPMDIEPTWTKYRTDLFKLEDLRINRLVSGDDQAKHQLHGFSDASEKAYAATIYIRTQLPNGTVSTHLLTSKTKVAPVKKISIPRLELCGAVLLARLLKKVKGSLHTEVDSIHAWTDSTITLAWISTHPGKWVTFVANRVAEIQSLINPSCWRYVPTKENPADHASRGISAEDLINCSLWWNGPPWLGADEEFWPRLACPLRDKDLIEMKKIKMMQVLTSQTTPGWNIISKYSSLNRLKRVMAYCLRFLFNCRKPRDERRISALTAGEIQLAFTRCIVYVQGREFSETILALEKDGSTKGQLATLCPFIDKSGVLRVGGRLSNSTLPFDQKYPVLLPKNHHLTRLVVRDEHEKNLHAGPTLTLTSIQQRFWIVGGRAAVRQLIHRCVRCTRERARTLDQRMGDLPLSRVEPSRLFLKTGVDYGGPFTIKTMRGRGAKSTKAYLALFVCLATKAVHLELVTDLTSEAFIAALRRFIARRGKPSDLFSDNVPNTDVIDALATDSINWHFIPARGPHFGGLWEAGIKSVKRHLRLVVGDQHLTFEELYTTLTQIEACLNSRPLCNLTTDPNDPAALTPGHFLIGHPLTGAPDPDLTTLKVSRLSRWQLVQQITQHFWKS